MSRENSSSHRSQKEMTATAERKPTDAPDDLPRRARVEHTRAELITQDSAIRESLGQEAQNLSRIANDFRARDIRRLVIVGCGDSWFIGMGVKLAFEQWAHLPTEAVQAFDLAHYYHLAVDSSVAVMGISSRGDTPAVMDALHIARERGAFTIGMTNTRGARIANEFDRAILVRATRVGWPTQSSTAAMAVLTRLAIELGAARGKLSTCECASGLEQLVQLSAQARTIINSSEEPMRELAQHLLDARLMFFVGAGPHFATASFGAAKVRELTPIHAVALHLEEFHHYRSIKPEDPLVIIAPDAESHVRALDTARIARDNNSRVASFILSTETMIRDLSRWSHEVPEVPNALAPIIHSIPLQWFAYHLAVGMFDHAIGFSKPGAEVDTSLQPT